MSKNANFPNLADRFCRPAVPLILILSIFGSFILGRRENPDFTLKNGESVSVFIANISLILAISFGFVFPLLINIPLRRAIKKSNSDNGVVVGYKTVEDFYDVNTLILDAKNLFESPIRSKENTKKSNISQITGIKIMGGLNQSEVLSYAASLVIAADSVLSENFRGILNNTRNVFNQGWGNGKENAIIPIEKLSIDYTGGWSGWVKNQPLLFGNREFMISNGVEGMPGILEIPDYVKNTKDDVFYFSISGKFAALVSVELKCDRNVIEAIQKLAKQKVYFVIHTVDWNISVSKLSKILKISSDNLKIIPESMSQDYKTESTPRVSSPVNMVCSGRITAVSRMLLSMKKLYHTAFFGLLLQVVAIIIGTVFVVLSAFLDFEMTPIKVAFFNLITGTLVLLGTCFRKY
jgi:Cu+-exporting ATPase